MIQPTHTNLDPTYISFLIEEVFYHPKCEYFPSLSKNQVTIAYKLALDLHLNQKRLNNKPYIEHINRSIRIYLNETLDASEKCLPANLIALILHDCVEDNPNGLIEITNKGFDTEIILDILWMSEPSASVIEQVVQLEHTHRDIYQNIEDRGFLIIYSTIKKNDPEKFIITLIGDSNLSLTMSEHLLDLWSHFCLPKYQAQHDTRGQHKIYAEYMFLCMIARMPRELLRIKATERRDNMQDTEGLLTPAGVRSAQFTMHTTMSVYVPRAREVADDTLVKSLILDRNTELAQFVTQGLL